MGRADRARRERPSRRLSFGPRRPAGPGSLTPGALASRLPRLAVRLASCALLAALLAVPHGAEAQSEQTLVSNAGQAQGSYNVVGSIAELRYTQAQKFTTGDNEDGYTLSAVRFRIWTYSSDGAKVSIHADASGNPGRSLYVLASPAPIANNGFNAFAAPPGATLEANTDYFVVIEGGASGYFIVGDTRAAAEDAGAADGWSIDDRRHWRLSDDGGWLAAHGQSLQISVSGTVDTAASADATLRGLAVNDGAGDLALDPAFAADTYDYAATVPHAVERATVTPAANDPGAALSYSAADADTGAPGRQVHLEVGANPVAVTVTAADGATRLTYTVTVTRAAEPASTVTPRSSHSSDLPWSTTMMVGETSKGARGYNNDIPVGTLDDRDLTYDGFDGIVTHLVMHDPVEDTSGLQFEVSNINVGFDEMHADTLVLEVEGEELAFSAAEDRNRRESTVYWISSWLDDNALSLSATDFKNTLAVGSTVKVCLRDSAVTTQVCPGGSTTDNNDPTVETEIPDQPATAGTAFSYTFPDTTFNDSDTGDTLTYTATLADADDSPLSTTWLAFDAVTRTFSGTPTAVETLAVRVTASDGTAMVSDEFDITVAAPAPPSSCETTDIWCAALVVSEFSLGAGTQYGYAAIANVSEGALSEDEFSYPPGTGYTVGAVLRDESVGVNLKLALAPHGGSVFDDRFALLVDGERFNFDDAVAPAGSGQFFQWASTGLDWAAGDTVVLRLIENSPASGAPTISGTPQVGQTLTANKGNIADANGLPSTTFPAGYTFQWVSVDGGTETDITGATSQTYTPVADDVGSTIKVYVSFEDDAGFDETLASAETAAVAAGFVCTAPVLTGRTEVWTGTLTIHKFEAAGLTTGYGFNSTQGGLSSKTFPFGEDDYTINIILLKGEGAFYSTPTKLRFVLNKQWPAADRALLRLHVCDCHARRERRNL